MIDIPGRVFLDTSVVNFILDYGEQIHDGAALPQDANERVARDVEALRNIFMVGQRANWQLAVSPLTYKEVISTADSHRQMFLKRWFFEIWHHWQAILKEQDDLPSFREAEQTRVELLASDKLDLLPGIEDRMLICDSIVYRCEGFCTRDWKTILKHRSSLSTLPVAILAPHEWWEQVSLWAGIW